MDEHENEHENEHESEHESESQSERQSEHESEHQNKRESADAVPKTDKQRVFIRDAALFHTKLLVDGLRDLVLFPAALVAAVIDLIRREDPPGRLFYDVVHFGQQTEGWINLFEAVNHAPETDEPRPTIDGPSLDDLVDELEAKLKSGDEKGEISASAKKAVDQILEAAKKVVKKARS